MGFLSQKKTADSQGVTQEEWREVELYVMKTSANEWKMIAKKEGKRESRARNKNLEMNLTMTMMTAISDDPKVKINYIKPFIFYMQLFIVIIVLNSLL